MALVCQNRLRNCEIPCGMELLVRNQALPLRNAFRSCEMDATVLRSGTRVPRLVSQLENTLRNGAFPAKWRISCFGGSQPLSQLRNGGSCAAKWHSCAKFGFAAAKFPRRDFYSVAEWFGNKMPISQRLRNLADPCFSPVFAPFDSDFAPILLRFFSFNFFAIPLDFDHPKTYITSKQTRIKALKSKLKH
ncbi:hypothetical protein VitviT2T_016939 [Vitis vinifera]|uniref:Uncharacterized protein n=1 Tax=Vitis vinifera TaxID=29760 RepID=A0ABY9CTF7_VITVI|nr:hypothetical protein VitviT2T_016939 [Vitis vinifera]